MLISPQAISYSARNVSYALQQAKPVAQVVGRTATKIALNIGSTIVLTGISLSLVSGMEQARKSLAVHRDRRPGHKSPVAQEMFAALDALYSHGATRQTGRIVATGYKTRLPNAVDLFEGYWTALRLSATNISEQPEARTEDWLTSANA